jgi:beta-phosphoglucomutase-like phosphatase (HAD superfamily)
MISTVIFDLDGLLTDTDRLHCQAWRQTLAGVGLPLLDTLR